MLSQVETELAEGQTLTVQECAHIAQRSPSWVRDRIHAGGLRASRRDRRLLVDAASLERLLIRLAERRSRNANPPANEHLRLVVDNTAGRN